MERTVCLLIDDQVWDRELWRISAESADRPVQRLIQRYCTAQGAAADTLSLAAGRVRIVVTDA